MPLCKITFEHDNALCIHLEVNSDIKFFPQKKDVIAKMSAIINHNMSSSATAASNFIENASQRASEGPLKNTICAREDNLYVVLNEADWRLCGREDDMAQRVVGNVFQALHKAYHQLSPNKTTKEESDYEAFFNRRSR